MKRATWSVYVALLAVAGPAAAADFSFIGTASTGDGNVIYEERHSVDGTCEEGVFRPRQHKVAYFKADADESFARKDLEYEVSLLRPSVDFVQPTFSEEAKRFVNLVQNQIIGINKART